MENNTCPYCGSEEDPELSGRCFIKYKCDSTKWIDKYTGKTGSDQSEDCMRIELAALRSQNRDLQQAYDHVLECEQNRCREVVELQDRLAELRRLIDDAPVWFAVIGSRSDAPECVVPNEPTANDIHNMIPGTCGVARVRLVRDDQPGETDA